MARKLNPTTKLKRDIAKATGIPTTKSGRKAKLNRELRKAIGLPAKKTTFEKIVDILIKDIKK